MNALNEAEFFGSLPCKKMAVGIMIRDLQGRLLVVQQTFDGRWSLPGGIIELNESPCQAGRRELFDETGLKRRKLRFLGVDYTSPVPVRGESLQFMFDAGRVTESQKRHIHPQPSEIAAIRFIYPAQACAMFTPWLSRRVKRFLRVLTGKSPPLYLEDAN